MKANLRRLLNRVKDPSLAGRLRVAYGDDLDRLFLNFKKDVMQRLGKRELAEVTAGTVIINKTIEYSLNATITIPAKPIIKKNVGKGYFAGATRGTQLLNAVGVTYSYNQTAADQHVIDLLEQRNLTELDGITAAMSSDITRTISDGVMNGKGIDDISSDIEEAVDGIGRDRARLLARTETMTAFNSAAKQQYDRVGVTEVEWYTSHLENVCDDCDELDGQRFPIDEAPPCPFHPNCPCILLPVIDIPSLGVR